MPRASRSACSASTGTRPTRKLAKQEIARQSADLREAQERFQRAVSGTQDALFEFNLRTGETWYSPRFREMLGYAATDSDADGQIETFIHPDDGAIVGKAMGDHLTFGLPYDVEYRLRKHDGEWLWVRSRASAERDTEDRPLWLAGSIRDITDERAGRDAMVHGDAGSGRSEPRQEHVPRDHEPRDPHADERHHRHDRPAAGNAASTARSATTPRPSAPAPTRC